jgi:hypothetical protein
MTADPAEPTPRAQPSLPAWHPAWAKELAELYYSGTISMFVLHGNVHDLVRSEREEGKPLYLGLGEFLATEVFGAWDVVLTYDLGRGLRPLAGGDAKRLASMVQYTNAQIGAPGTWSREPDKVMDVLEQLLQRNLLEEVPANRKSIGIVIEHAEYVLPVGDLATLSRGHAARLVRLIGWAGNPYIKRLNVAFCLVTAKLSEVSERLVQNPHVAAIDVPLPDVEARRAFIADAAGKSAAPPAGMSTEAIAQNSAGLNLVNLRVLLSQGAKRGIELKEFRRLKKSMIERQCQGLVEFV